MKVILKDKKTGSTKYWYDLNWGGSARQGYLPVLEIGEERKFCPDNRISVDPNNYNIVPMDESGADPIYSLNLNESHHTGHNEWSFSQIAQKVPGGWNYICFDNETDKPFDSGVFVPDPRQTATARQNVSKVIFEAGNVLIPFVEAQSIYKFEMYGKLEKIIIKMKGEKENKIHLLNVDGIAEKFIIEWTRYRREIEATRT